MNIDLENELNPQQKKAVMKKDGPALIISGPGSGKTRVITYRTCALIKRGVKPKNILVLTFTNKAARNMKERINKKVDTRIDRMWMGTFHAVGLRILSDNLDKIDYPDYFVIYDTPDQRSLIEEIADDMKININGFGDGGAQRIINQAKINLVNPENFLEYYLEDKPRELSRSDRVLQQIYSEYEKRLKNNAAFDFSDLIKKTIELLEKDKSVRSKYQNKFKYVMIDEYQDTNLSQYRMSKILAQPQNNLFAVGDESQGIYSFRGADIRNILEFENNFPDSEVIKLERNYRSKENIVKASNELIKNNINRREKESWTDKDKGQDIFVVENGSPDLESEFVSNMILRLKSQYDYDDMAIFYRSHYLSNDMENALIENNIPYTIVGSSQFLDRKEVRFMINLIKVGINPDDDVSLTRMIKEFNNDVGTITINRIKDYAKNNSMSIVDVMYNSENVRGIGKKRSKAVNKFLEDYLEPIRKIVNDSENNMFNKMERIYRNFHNEILITLGGNEQERDENMRELVNFARNYYNNDEGRTLSDFLNYLTIVDEAEEADEDEDSVNLMTIHASKGLEFKVVFVIGMEEGILPHKRSIEENENGIEEERRLCYVAMTRAEERLFLSYCSGRMVFGRWVNKESSRFIEEIPEDKTRIIRNYRNTGGY